jgi:hypothetical protein
LPSNNLAWTIVKKKFIYIHITLVGAGEGLAFFAGSSSFLSLRAG